MAEIDTIAGIDLVAGSDREYSVTQNVVVGSGIDSPPFGSTFYCESGGILRFGAGCNTEFYECTIIERDSAPSLGGNNYNGTNARFYGGSTCQPIFYGCDFVQEDGINRSDWDVASDGAAPEFRTSTADGQSRKCRITIYDSASSTQYNHFPNPNLIIDGLIVDMQRNGGAFEIGIPPSINDLTVVDNNPGSGDRHVVVLTRDWPSGANTYDVSNLSCRNVSTLEGDADDTLRLVNPVGDIPRTDDGNAFIQAVQEIWRTYRTNLIDLVTKADIDARIIITSNSDEAVKFDENLANGTFDEILFQQGASYENESYDIVDNVYTRTFYDYNYEIVSDTITIAWNPASPSGLLQPDITVSTKAGQTELVESTVAAYTSLETLDKVLDGIHYQAGQRTARHTVGDSPVDGAGNALNFGSANLTVTNATPSGYPAEYDGNYTVYTDSQNLTLGSKTAITTTGVVTFSQANTLPDNLIVNGDIILGEVTDLTGVTVSGSITLEVAGTYNWAGCTVGEVINTSGGAVTIQADTATVITTNTGPNISIVAPPLSRTISTDQTALIQIFDGDTQTLLASTTGTELEYVYSGTPIIREVVLAAGYSPIRSAQIALTSTSSVSSYSLVSDPVYISGHGLTYGSDFSYNRSTARLTVSTSANGDAIYSALIDAFISESSLYNTMFPLQPNGPSAFFFLDASEFFDSSSLNNWKRAGFTYLNSSGIETQRNAAIYTLSSGIPETALAEYQQTVGSGTTDAINTGAINQTIQIYGDASHGNFTLDTHLVVKYQVNGYQQIRVDVVDLYGLSTLQAVAYPIATPFTQLSASTGDPAISITIVDHTAAPITVGGKLFSYEVQDNGINSGEDILREINYSNSLDITYQGKDPFNWPDIAGELGSSYDTKRGWVESEAAEYGFYVSRGGSDHPDFSRFQSDDSSYYTPVVQATATISNMTAGSRLRIYNQTTGVETVNQINAGTSYSQSYINGTTYTAGDIVEVYLTYQSGTSAQLGFSANAVVTSDGWSVLSDQEADSVYGLNAIDGSTITKFTADYVGSEVDISSSSNFTAQEFYAWWAYNLTTEEGIREFFGGVTAADAANYKINTTVVDIYWDNITTTNLRQTDSARIYRDDEVYPVTNGGATTGGGGVDINWKNVVYLATTGSALTPAQDASLSAIESKTDSLTYTKTNELDVNIKSVNNLSVDGSGTSGDPWGPA